MNRTAYISLFYALLPFLAVWAVQADDIKLQPHRAAYEITLGAAKTRNSLSSATGKLTYEFIGDACEGYSTKTHFLTALQSQEGSTQTTDITSTTFESGDGREIRFLTAAKSNDKITNSADGTARRQDDDTLKVSLNLPKKQVLSFGPGALFPSQHSLALLKTARSDENIFRADLFDGTEGAKKVYATTGIIGKARDEVAPDHPAASLAKLPRYKIALSFFGPEADRSGEQTEMYNVASVLFDNGVTYSLRLNYPEFSFEARMISLELLPAGNCK